MTEALSHRYWKMVMERVAEHGATETEKDLAKFCGDLLDLAGDNQSVVQYLTDRAQRAVRDVA